MFARCPIDGLISFVFRAYFDNDKTRESRQNDLLTEFFLGVVVRPGLGRGIFIFLFFLKGIGDLLIWNGGGTRNEAVGDRDVGKGDLMGL